MDTKHLKPQIYDYHQTITDDISLHLIIIEYSNAIQASLFDGQPKLGSMSLAYTMGEQLDRQTIFAGKHGQFADSLALILGKVSQKIVYASVNIQEDSVLNLELIKKLVDKYKNEKQSDNSQ